MPQIMRCQYCGLLQDEPHGVKECRRCGGELAFEQPTPPDPHGSYLQVQMELDQVSAPAGQTIDRHLLVSIRTPSQVPPEQAAATGSGRPPLNLSAVLDVSGSMRGDKLLYMKQAVRQALRFLRRGDGVALIVFSDSARLLQEHTPVDERVQAALENTLAKVTATGSTALDAGLALGIEQAIKQPFDSNLVLLLSDGQANIGETDLEKVGMRASQARTAGLVVSTLGVGHDYNEALMSEIAVQGGGRFYHVESPDQIVPYLTGELGEAADLAARDVQIRINLPPGAVLVPFSAAYKAEMVDGKALISIGDIPRDLEVEIPLRLTLYSGNAGSRLSLDGELVYRSPAGSQLVSALNRVTVRFVAGLAFQLNEGVVTPVAERVAKQMRAAQVLRFARASARGIGEELSQAERERGRLKEYVQLLGDEKARQMLGELEQDLQHVRAASPAAKHVTAQAFKANRFMRDLDKKD
jgi:Ca-activated chloride channel family protein